MYIKFNNIEIMNLRALHSLLTIAQTGSFRETAERLNMTLSALSMQIKALENELDVQLFDRTFRPPQLTPIGRKIVRHAEPVVSAHQALLGALGDNQTLSGEYHIGFVLTASVRLLPQMLLNARSACPDVQFRLQTGVTESLIKQVHNGTLDAAVLTGEHAFPQDLRTRHLVREELKFALPPQAGAMPVSQALQQLTFIHFTPETGIGRLIAQALAARKAAPPRTIILDGIEAVMESVNRGVGMTALPEPDIERYAAKGVTAHPIADPPLSRDLILVSRAQGLGNAEIEQLVRLLG